MRDIRRLSDIAIVGAGPYGLSVAAHLAARGADFRILGEPLSTWRRHMPQGMLLKSDGFASSLSAPVDGASLRDYCAANGLPYGDRGEPVQLDTFVRYGMAFQERYVPNLEPRSVVALDRTPRGYRLELDDGEVFEARRVVLAVGITHFDQVPDVLKALPADRLTHSSAHDQVCGFRGRDVTVLGAGSSAIDLVAQLQEAGARTRLVARTPRIKFASPPTGRPPSLWRRVRHPPSGLGPGLRSRLACDAPDLFRLLPAALRLEIVRRHLGPSSPWHLRAKIEGAEVLNGHTVAGAEMADGRVRLRLMSQTGAETAVEADHVISATGYRVDLRRLGFMASGLRASLRAVNHMPVLSSTFESSAPGLHFVGLAASGSFGPLMRFMYGADFAARRVSGHLVRAVGQGRR